MAKSKKKTDKTSNLKQTKKIFAATFILLLMVIGSFTIIYIYYPPNIKKSITAKNKKVFIPENKKPVIQNRLKKKLKTDKKPIYEIYSHSPAHKDIPHKKVDYTGSPKIALIIDDIGFDKDISIKFSNLGIPITLSVLPYTPYGKYIINKTKNNNTEFMLHLPMQPKEYPKVNPGKGALLSDMTPDELTNSLEQTLKWIPRVKGVNNHMGSYLTEDSIKMKQIFITIKKQNLYFVDSLTSSKSQCMGVAKLFKVDFAKRDIFLDNIQDEKYIISQLEKLKEIALKQGYAVGIGHPYHATIKALEKNINTLKKDVIFVKASSIVKTIQ